MQSRHFERSHAVENLVPLEPGSYRSVKKRQGPSVVVGAIGAPLGLVIVIVGMVLMQNSAPAGVPLLILGAAVASSFAVLALAPAARPLIVRQNGLTIRRGELPDSWIGFSRVAAIAVFPELVTAKGTQSLAVFLSANGRKFWSADSLLFAPDVVPRLVALAHRHHGSPVYLCSGPLTMSEVGFGFYLPQLTGAPDALAPSTWMPCVPLFSPPGIPTAG